MKKSNARDTTNFTTIFLQTHVHLDGRCQLLKLTPKFTRN